MALSSFRDFIEEATSIVKGAGERGIPLKLMGALAVSLHCPKYGHFHEKMERAPTDIDFASYSEFKSKLTTFLQSLGYKTDVRMMSFPAYAEGKRYIYQGKTQVDVFFDELRMCHTVSWRKRLEVDDPTIPLADIVLEKLQIVEINPKDIKDLILLFLEHDVGDVDEETINGKYIAELLSRDWGFYYTSTTNLKKLVNLTGQYSELSPDESRTVQGRVDKLVSMIEEQPKSMGWKMRSRVGTKQKWYTEVADDYRVLKIE
jgi:hypothetical protein